jgi:alpha-3'-ketoglucosidase
MKHLALLLAVTLLVGCTESNDYTEAALVSDSAQAVGEWETLFDGTSLDAFRGFKRDTVPGTWGIVDGTLAFIPGGGEGGDIITRDQFENFELELEWKISPAGNSGIIYRATEEFDAPWMTGPEYQVLDNLLHPDAAHGKDRMAGANYDMQESDPDAVNPVGEWNTARILAHHNHVEHWLNGQKVAEYMLYSDAWKGLVAASKWKDHPAYGQRLSGHIALQDHGNPVWFRNIRIKRL